VGATGAGGGLSVFGEQEVVAQDWETVGKNVKNYPALLSSVK